MANRFKGRIVHIGSVENVGKKKPFFKRTFVLDDSVDERYPNTVPFELTRDDTSLIDGFHEGEEVVVEYYLNGRAWDNPKTGKTAYFLSAKAVKVTARADADNANDGGVEAEPTEEAAPAEDEGLPF